MHKINVENVIQTKINIIMEFASRLMGISN